MLLLSVSIVCVTPPPPRLMVTLTDTLADHNSNVNIVITLHIHRSLGKCVKSRDDPIKCHRRYFRHPTASPGKWMCQRFYVVIIRGDRQAKTSPKRFNAHCELPNRLRVTRSLKSKSNWSRNCCCWCCCCCRYCCRFVKEIASRGGASYGLHDYGNTLWKVELARCWFVLNSRPS